MLEIAAVNHVGIRVRDKTRSIQFYESLGLGLVTEVGFEYGHPVIVRHDRGAGVDTFGLTAVSGGRNGRRAS